MKTSSGTKTANALSNSKMKKTGKEREKRKSHTGTEKSEQNAEKGSPTKDSSSRKYAGIGPDSILIYSEQSSIELPEEKELSFGLAEDISYKLRYIIHEALVKARLSGRNHIRSTDIDATFENLNIDKVYGADCSPNWISFGEQNLSYLDDSEVNLINLSEQENSYSQPTNIILTRKWLPELKDVGKTLKKYFEVMCFAVVSSDSDVRQMALKDLKENNYIGPVVEWFYHFGYFLLSKDITYDSLTLCALDLIRSLEESAVAPQIVSEKQIKLLVRLILQRLLRSATTIEVLKPMCRVLAILCDRMPINLMVSLKLIQKMNELKHNFALPIITIINELGIRAVHILLEPYCDDFLETVEQNMEPNLVSALLNSYSIAGNEMNIDLYEKYKKVFGEALVPLWKSPVIHIKVEKLETNWRKILLLKSRKKMTYNPKRKKYVTFEEMFPEDELPDEEPAPKPPIQFKFYSFNTATGRQRFLNKCEQPLYNLKPNSVIVGKRTLSLHISRDYSPTFHPSPNRCYHPTLSSVII